MSRRPARHGGAQATGDAPARSTTPERIITAALATLRAEGFAGTSARSIARHGAFNQALIFYHFGSVTDLLVAAMERASAERLEGYRRALAGAANLAEALSIAERQYGVDSQDGHSFVLVELFAGASNVPALGPEIVRCLQPWLEFAEERITHFITGTVLERIVPPRAAAQAVVAFYLGMELLEHLDSSAPPGPALFAAASSMLEAADPMLGRTGAHPAASRRPRRVPVEGADQR